MLEIYLKSKNNSHKNFLYLLLMLKNISASKNKFTYYIYINQKTFMNFKFLYTLIYAIIELIKLYTYI